MAVPASRYRASPICFPQRLPEPEYNATDLVRRVGVDGYTRFKGRSLKLSQAFAGLDVGFRATVIEGVWKVFFMRFAITEVDLRDEQTQISTARDVSEHPSGMSPV